MSNLMRLVNKTKTIEERADKIFNKILGEYNRGKVKSETEMLYKLFAALRSFYKSIGRPTFVLRPARGTPVSEDYNQMIDEAVGDIRSIISEVGNLNQVLEQSFSETELDRKMLQNKTRLVFRRLNDLQSKVRNEDSDLSFSEYFVNANNMDREMAKGTLANINTAEGILTLSKTSNEEYASTCDVEVLNTSNGFPGNTHIANTLNNGLHFDGEDNLHIDLRDVLDSNRDTWFEYELFSITDNVYDATSGLGFGYKEGIQWADYSSMLNLGVKLTLKEPKVCNWVSLSPFIPEHKGARPCVVRKITVSDGKGAVQHILSSSKSFDDDLVFIFQKQVCKTILVEFEQHLPYEVEVGHFYFTESNTDNLNQFDDAIGSYDSRTHGPEPSVELLGIKYDPKTKTYIQPKLNDKVSFIDEAMIKSELFSLPATPSNIKASKEVVKALRYHIGIKNINISNYTFEENSEYVSVSYESEEPITVITLDASEMTPESFQDGDWIKYSISLDEGENWHPIVPIYRAYSGKSIYSINSKTPIELRQPDTGYVELPAQAHTVRLKIELTRPNDNPDNIYNTPVVFGYNLKIKTGVEASEY